MSQIDKKLAALLEPGTVWVRPDSGKKVTVLFVLNTSLKGENARKFPVQVSYIDEKGNYLAVPVDRFVEDREYYMINPLVNSRLEHLLDAEEVKETEAPAEVDLNEETTEEADPEQETDVGPEDVEALPPPFLFAQFRSSSDTEMPVVDPLTLGANIMQYEQDPHIDPVIPGLSRLRHKLVVALVDGLTIQTLNDSFSPPFENAPFYKEFSINGITVDWDEYQGAYPVIANDGTFASVVFTTPLKGGELSEVPEESLVEAPESVSVTVADSTITVASNGNVTIDAPAVAVSGEVAVNPIQAAVQPAQVPVQVQVQPVQAQVQVESAVAQPEDEPKFKIIDDDAADEAVIFGQQ